MDVNGPIKVGVVEPSPQGDYELHISFTDEFKAADLASQAQRTTGVNLVDLLGY